MTWVQPAETLAHHVGRKLRKVRIAKGLTLNKVADAVGTSPQTVQRLETANMALSVEWIERLCKAYQIQPIDLFDGSPMMTFEAKLQRESAKAAIKVLCGALKLPCPESLE